MEFGPEHYTRDWELLACVCAEWTQIRARFGLGSRASREQIERFWDEIFNADPQARPCIRRLFREMMEDQLLARHLCRCYWRALRPWERRGYTFEEVLPWAVYRLLWTVVRNSCTWLGFRETSEHWARFWNTPNLTEELRRTINDMWDNEGPRDQPLPANV
jgi:hypothetical protein